MPSDPTPAASHRFCSDCGTQLNVGARFCHNCGAPLGGRGAGAGTSNALRWGLPAFALIAVVALVAGQYGSRNGGGAATAGPLTMGGGTMAAPDISSMSPEERADRLFNRVMRLTSEGKTDSAAFFGPMALSAIEALAPLDAHRRYDAGLVALVTGDVAMAAAQADTILSRTATHLLGLSLAARAADARGNATAGKDFRRRLMAAEPAERKRGLPEYTDHNADILEAIKVAGAR